MMSRMMARMATRTKHLHISEALFSINVNEGTNEKSMTPPRSLNSARSVDVDTLLGCANRSTTRR